MRSAIPVSALRNVRYIAQSLSPYLVESQSALDAEGHFFILTHVLQT